MSDDHNGSIGFRPEGDGVWRARYLTRKNLARLLALFGLAVAGLLAFSGPDAGAAPDDGETLENAVVAAMGEADSSQRSLASTEGDTQVNVMREEDGWAFGSAVMEAPEKEGYYPEGWLFIAESAGDGWDVALEGDEGFPDMTAEAPETVVSQGEKDTFAAQDDSLRTTSGASAKTGLMLPWKNGTSWRFSGGPHGWATGTDRPYSSLDLTGRGSDQRVLSAGPGRVYNMCSTKRGWIRVYHPNGLSTDYYHLARNIQPKQGARIEKGKFLGLTGTDTSCGGAAYGRHVHFALLRGDNRIAMDGKTIGGWTFQEGRAYEGYAQRRDNRRYPGDNLKNFGAS